MDIGVPLAIDTDVTVPAPMELRKVAAVKADIVLSALNLGKVIADGLVKVNIDCPIVLPPKLVLPVAATRSVLPPSHFSRSLYAMFQLLELFVMEDAQALPVDKAMPASG